MDPVRSPEITELLRAWRDGDGKALEELTPIVHQELHQIARRYLQREQPGQTLQTTALMNEAYVRLIDVNRVSWQDRAHFFAVCAQMMRRILVDAARARRRLKRGEQPLRVSFDEGVLISGRQDAALVALNDALETLAKIDPRKGKVIELRFFVGLRVEEIAEVLKISPQTVLRDWRLAKAWLHRELRGSVPPD
jgi:RNA polymerase sigma-70 factor, ECF subfamily